MPARPSPPRGLPQPLPPHERFRRASNVAVIERGDTIVLLSLDRGRRYRLDLIASQVWWAFGEELSVTAVAEWLRAKYPSSARTADVDALQLLAMLYNAGLIEPVPGARST